MRRYWKSRRKEYEMDDMSIVLLGAGKTGRGFLARLFHTQAHITFIDKDPGLIRELKEKKKYAIRFFDQEKTEEIRGYDALCTQDAACKQALQSCTAVFVSVRGENTPAAGAWLSDKIAPATCVIACENASLPASLLGPLAGRACSGAVFCTTVLDNGLDILSENYPSLHVDAHNLSKAVARLSGIRVSQDFPLLMLRKIYTYNAASAIIAYLGAEKGFREYAGAANDPEIEAAIDAFYSQINAAISAEYGVPYEEQAAFAASSKAKFQSHAIADTVRRNAASPARKLGSEERLIAPARLIAKHGGDPSPLLQAAAAALRYMGISSRPEAEKVLEQTAKLTGKDPFMPIILDYFCR